MNCIVTRPLRSLVFVCLAGCSQPQELTAPSQRDPVDISFDFEPAPVSLPVTLTAPQETTKRASAEQDVLVATSLHSSIYSEPARTASQLGSVRLGERVHRARLPVSGRGCRGFWYQIEPRGYMCAEDASSQADPKLVRAVGRGSNREQPLPYSYAIAQAKAPQYLRVPSGEEQRKSEPQLQEELKRYSEQRPALLRVSMGANDVPLDATGRPALGKGLPAGQRLSPQLEPNELFGGAKGRGVFPAWLNGGRGIPPFGTGQDVKPDQLSWGSVERNQGLAFVDSFVTEEAGESRGFAVTTTLRLVPTAKLKPVRGSTFHGLVLTESMAWPLAFVVDKQARGWQLIRGEDEAVAAAALPQRAVIPMSGQVRYKAGRRFYQTRREPTLWLAANSVGLLIKPPSFPREAERGEKWVDISLLQQTLVLYQGGTPVYATLVSTGKARLGKPSRPKPTALGTFRILSKAITATVDSWEDAPWLQSLGDDLFIHAAYWHDDFGQARRGEGISLSPVDARHVFLWTEPSLPAGWHSIGKAAASGRAVVRGTTVVVRK